jgi:hypothetical protein
MSITQNNYTGDGTTVLYAFTFPYLETTDIKVSVSGVDTTAFTLANATTVQFNTAPANGAPIRIYRNTDDSQLSATFFPGSAIRSQDLNENFTQNLYKIQEINDYSLQDVGNITLQANYTFLYSPSGPTPVNNDHLVTKGYVDGLALSTSVPDGNRGDITVSSSGIVWTLSTNAVTTAKILDGAVTPSKLSASYQQAFTTTTTGISKTLANRENCTVTTAGLTITLPATPAVGSEVIVSVADTFVNTVIARNGSNIMSLAENLTLDAPYASVNLFYVDASNGWRIIG